MYFWLNRDKKSGSLNKLYECAGITKQGFAKQRKKQVSYKEEESYVKFIVLQVRKDHPTMSCRSIYYKMNPVFIGRDRFEKLCRELGLNVVKSKSKKKTTDSTGVKRFANLTVGKKAEYIDQIWSSDITYFEINGVFYYLTFILDNCSRRILGYSVSSRLLTSQTTIPALKMAIKTRNGQIRTAIILHSDGGGQYYADDFLKLTQAYHFQNSMCEYAWENGKAERINGVIKNNYLKHWNINTLPALVKKVDLAVNLYNTDKPHISLSRMTPVEYEQKLAILHMQNKSVKKDSFDVKGQNCGVSNPTISEAKQAN